MAYPPIEDHGVIGDMHTIALVCLNGTIDWLCFPSFDSPSVFARILDDDKGGHFSINPIHDGISEKQFYWPDTNVLLTRFLSHDGVAEITDFMPIHNPEGGHGKHQIIRRVRGVRGSLKIRMECYPAFNFARDDHDVEMVDSGAVFHSKNLSLALGTDQQLRQDQRGVSTEFELNEGNTVTFILHEVNDNDKGGRLIDENEFDSHLERTVNFWRNWLSQSTYTGRWRELVDRSALVLKLLTYEPTGAIVAAPTTSLPEDMGGERNWDYRYTWIRDAAFSLYALLRIGFTEEAARFMDFIEARTHELEKDGSLQVIYGINGSHTMEEEKLEHLDGFKGSRPVRIGNGAYHQLQLDIYGELMDSVYLYNKYGSPISYNFWSEIRRMIDWVCENWQRKDEGIWEVRSGQHHFVYSKMMIWVALDRAIRLADKRSFPADREKWLRYRDDVYEEIMQKGWNKKRKAFVQTYGGDTLDASSLMMPLVFFLSPTDPRMLNTLDAILESPENGGLVSDSLVYRYHVDHGIDGLKGDEGTFNICTFWLVEALTRAGRVDPKRLNHARIMFEKMTGYANHLGLYSEETGPRGEALGNFPQAFTHLSLISAAYNLNRAMRGKKVG